MVDRVALVAILGDDIIGVGRYDRWPGKDEAEVAFIVDDEHQGRGISTVMLEHLSAIARARGITRFTAEVLPDNRSMLAVFRKAGFEVRNEFSGGIVDVVFDIVPTPEFVEKVEQRERRAGSRSIARILQPRTVAVIGASDRPGSVGRAVFRNLLSSGFDGPVYPVNPFTAHVASVPTWDRVQDIPDDVHLAVIAVPAEEVEQVVADCAEKRVRGVVVISTGFSDAGTVEGLERERRLVHMARANGIRLLGPACMGFVRWGDEGRLVASFTQAPLRRGNLAVSLQSGPLGSAMLEHASKLGLGISSFVSLGNKADVSANDLLTYWEDDPDTGVIAVYTESFGNPRKFARIARRVSRKKPIVAVKAGRGATSTTWPPTRCTSRPG
jgi:succinyl-CoA synthetase alpha subunit/GNAT superfamily N-acetyltransferase